MRELSLEELESELLRIAVQQRPASPEFDTLLETVRSELKQRKEWRISGMEPERKQSLSAWWAGFPGLATYISE